MFGFGNSWNPIKDCPDLTGKVALVTGGNAGIGWGVVEQLAAHGAKVYMGARSEERAKAAIKKIEDAHPTVKEKKLVIWLPLDLTEPKDVIASTKDFMSREEKLDILVNNAARLASEYETSAHGDIELSIAINHIGHFVLVEHLMPILRRTALIPSSDVRIAIVTSAAHALCPKLVGFKNLDELNNPYVGFRNTNFYAQCLRYAYSKLCNELFKLELRRRLDAEDSQIIVLSAHPGFIGSEKAITSFPWYMRPLVWPWMGSAAAGATSSLFAATAPVVREQRNKYQGSYLDSDASIKTAFEQGRDPTLAAELWDLTQTIEDQILARKL